MARRRLPGIALNPRQIADRLAGVPLIAVLAPEDRLTLAEHVRPRRFQSEQPVFLQGDPGDEMFLLLDGSVRIVSESPSGREVTLAVLGEGSFFGDMALLDGEPRSASAYALEPCLSLALHRNDFNVFLDRTPRAARALLAFLSLRLRQANSRIHDATLLTVRQRMAALLCDLARREGEPCPEGILLPRRVNHRVLAELLTASRETVTRMASEFRAEGLLQQQGHQLVVLDLEGLRARMEE
ncbi:MAG: Crp/Fnr family transcriptional regulator [Candidatus Eremiobacterota bacterium]